MRIHLHLPRLASCLFWPIAKSGLRTIFPHAKSEKSEYSLCFGWAGVRQGDGARGAAVYA